MSSENIRVFIRPIISVCSRSGDIVSMNYLDGQYPRGARMDICIKKAPSDCGVQYNLQKMGVGVTKTGGLGYGLVII